MYNLKNYVLEFMEKSDCSKCEYDKDLCVKMFKNEKETPCVYIHKYLKQKESECGFGEVKIN